MREANRELGDQNTCLSSSSRLARALSTEPGQDFEHARRLEAHNNITFCVFSRSSESSAKPGFYLLMKRQAQAHCKGIVEAGKEITRATFANKIIFSSVTLRF